MITNVLEIIAGGGAVLIFSLPKTRRAVRVTVAPDGKHRGARRPYRG